MKTIQIIFQTCITACFVIVLGGVALRMFYADRVPPHVYIGAFPIGGAPTAQLSGVLSAYQQQLMQVPITITFRGRKTVRTFQDLSITVDQDKTQQAIMNAMRGVSITNPVRVAPVLAFQDDRARMALHNDFAQVLSLPKDASLSVDDAFHVSIVQSVIGEDFEMQVLDTAITDGAGMPSMPMITVMTAKADPKVTEQEVQQVQQFAQSLANTGFHLTYKDASFLISRQDVANMMRFVPSPAAHIAFDSALLKGYVEGKLSSQIHVEPINARFQVESGIVKQFALPKSGIDLDEDGTIKAVAAALSQSSSSVEVVGRELTPTFTDVASSSSLGITKLIATGETNFRGSPKNRMANIKVGAEKFNGILIAPGQEFSFDKLLGPVDASTGYLPELVIKNNATLPEFGGGLCQVSTTVFRAAMLAGVKITERHNHSYAVRYYGTPGFDATIYPPYTDFRFLNNTPGYLLIQTRIDGTKLFFEFWGTDDGRQVTIDGPYPYDRQADGSVKSVLKRAVTDKDGNVLENDTFNSNYKSPTLYPHEPAKQASNSDPASRESAPDGNA